MPAHRRPELRTPAASWPEGPLRPAAPAGEVHVWRAELGAAGPTGTEELPVDERRRAARLRRPGADRAWIASRWALRTVLSRYLDEDAAAIALRLDTYDKPELAEAPGRLDFNLSHSGALVLIGVTVGRGVGIDVERIDVDRDFLPLAEKGLEPAAAAAVRAAGPADRAAAFYDAWVRREALLKCRGGGLGNPAPEEPVAVRDLEIDRGYAAAAAVAGTEVLPCRRYSLGSF